MDRAVKTGRRRGHAKGRKKRIRAPAVPQPRVLVIDDNPAFLRSLARLLQLYGIDVATASDGRKGLAAFRKISPAVVLTDIDMPLQDGIGTIIAMRRERPAVKILAMSGGARFGKSDARIIAKKLGADSVLEKPFDIERLMAAIRRYLKSGS